MNIIISTQKITENTLQLKNHFTDKLQALEDKYKAKLTKAEGILEGKTHHLFFAEIVLHGSHINLDAKAETSNPYQSIDTAVDRLETQLAKLLSKQHSHR